MTSLNLRLPDDLHDYLKVTARKEGRSLNSHIVWTLQRAQALSTPSPTLPAAPSPPTKGPADDKP